LLNEVQCDRTTPMHYKGFCDNMKP